MSTCGGVVASQLAYGSLAGRQAVNAPAGRRSGAATPCPVFGVVHSARVCRLACLKSADVSSPAQQLEAFLTYQVL
jgi:hypothetical protein